MNSNRFLNIGFGDLSGLKINCVQALIYKYAFYMFVSTQLFLHFDHLYTVYTIHSYNVLYINNVIINI